MKVLAIIPARYASTRFPGKPLALLGGRPIIEHVWQRVSGTAAVSRAIVATDDDRIMQVVNAFGGEAMMTSANHQSGTDRCGEVLQALENKGEHYDIAINVQGDEPFIEPSQIEALIECFAHSDTEIATLKTPIHSDEELLSPNNVKVVCASDGKALYFSRLPIPYLRNKADRPTTTSMWASTPSAPKHSRPYAACNPDESNSARSWNSCAGSRQATASR